MYTDLPIVGVGGGVLGQLGQVSRCPRTPARDRGHVADNK